MYVVEDQPYKIIHLQNLQPRIQTQTEVYKPQNLCSKMNYKFRWSDNQVLYYQDSGLDENRINNQSFFTYNHFFDSFLLAYRNHGNIALNPDEVWLMIIFYFSNYVKQNAQSLRPKLVKHQGHKILTVIESVSSKQQSLQKQKLWDGYFDQIFHLMEQNTQNNVIETISCDFSTTKKFHKVVSTTLAMGALQKFFKYHRMFCICGISNVYMGGVREDWLKMEHKLQALAQFDVDGKLKQYISHMSVILHNFLKTWDEQPDLQWWRGVMKDPQSRQIYGGQQMDVTGWILHFLGIYKPTSISSFPQMMIKVPIRMINEVTKTDKQLLLVSDWVSVSKVNSNTYKPDLGVAIFANNNTQIMSEMNKSNNDYDYY